jgi:murein DD-endopeptidase MepM/ murein hydrolase activator NlpD
MKNQRICKHHGCKNILRSTNTIGYCRKHYRLSPKQKQKDKQYRDRKKKAKREYDKKYRKRNKKKIIKDKKSYYRKNKKRIQKSRKQYRIKNKKKILLRQHNYYWNNRKKILKYQAKYRKKHRKLLREKQEKIRKTKKNKKRTKDYQKRYIKTEWGKYVYARARRKRRALKNKLKENFTYEEQAATLIAFGSSCFLCNKTEDLCMDHFYPMSKNHALSVKNAIVLCRSCNSKKRSKSPKAFFIKIQFKRAKQLIKRAIKIHKQIKGKHVTKRNPTD